MIQKYLSRNVFQQLSLIFLIATLSFNVSAFEYSITKQEIQHAINKKLPLHKNLIVAKILVKQADISLIEEKNIAVLNTTFTVKLFDKKYSGKGELQSAVDYDQATGKFYLKALKVNSFNVDKLDPHFAEQLKKIIQDSLDSEQAKDQLARNAVYTIGDKKVKDKLLKATLKRVEIKKDKVVLILSPF